MAKTCRRSPRWCCVVIIFRSVPFYFRCSSLDFVHRLFSVSSLLLLNNKWLPFLLAHHAPCLFSISTSLASAFTTFSFRRCIIVILPCVYVCTSVGMLWWAKMPAKAGDVGSLRLELQGVVSCWRWVLRTELRSRSSQEQCVRLIVEH